MVCSDGSYYNALCFHNISHITAEHYPMTFLPCSREGQVTLPIHDDSTVEKNTNVSFTLEKSVDTDPMINLNRTTGYLIILDDSNDGMFHYYNILRQYTLMHINNIECLLIIIIIYNYVYLFLQHFDVIILPSCVCLSGSHGNSKRGG